MQLSDMQWEKALNAAHGQLATIADEFGVNYHSLRRELGERRKATERTPREELDALERGEYTPADDRMRVATCPPALNTLVRPALRVDLPSWIGIADVHTPFHDGTTIERACQVALRTRTRDLVIPGDFFDNGEYSRHGDDIAQVETNEALETAGKVLRFLSDYFDRIYMLPGNHCRRIAKRLNKNLSFRKLVLMAVGEYNIAERIITTEDDYLLIGDADVGQAPDAIGWVVGHPAFYSQQATAGYETLALLKRRHVFGSHRHTLGVKRYHNRYLCVDPGTACSAAMFPYIARSWGMSRHADQSNGFALVRGGRVQLFADGLTDWSEYGAV